MNRDHETMNQRFTRHWRNMSDDTRIALKNLAKNPKSENLRALVRFHADIEEEDTYKMVEQVVRNMDLDSMRRMVEEARV